MADDQIPTPEYGPPQLQPLIDELQEQLFDPKKLGRVERTITNAVQAALTTVIGVVLSLGAKIGAFLGRSILEAENQHQADFNELARVAILDMFGVDTGSVSATRGGGGNKDAADAIGGMLLTAFSGQAHAGDGEGGTIGPSDAPAKAFLSAMAQLSLEGWLSGWITEVVSLGQIETFGDLDDTISHVLGLGRASASVHGPLVRHFIVEPLEQKVLREHRPTLLSTSTVARQWYRGAWDWADVQEEFARAGYSDERIDALLREARRYISPDDVGVLNHRIGDTNFDAKQYLRDSGFDGHDADLHLQAAEAKILDSQERQFAAAILDAYVRGDVGVSEYRSLIGSLKLPARDEAFYLRFGELKRSLNRQQLSDGDAKAAVKRGLVTVGWYRGYLADIGLDDEAITIKELLLRGEIDASADAEKLRADQAAARAAEKLAAADARAKRIADKAVADAQPALSDVRRAFVRGLVDVGRLTAAIQLAHPGIAAADADALLSDAQLDRATFEQQQAAHAAALKKDTDKALPLAQLEQSVLRGIVSLDAYDRDLTTRGYADDDRAILVALMRSRVDDQAAAQKARTAAAARAELKQISLSDFERAVRLGLRPRADLVAFLEQLDTPDVEQGLILDLIDVDVARDQEATAKRAAADAAAAARAINLPLRRRAYVNGLRSRDDYMQDLVDADVAPDNRSIELDLADQERAQREATAAKAAALAQRATAADQARPPKTLSLAQLERAVKLQLLQPDDLRAQLHARGYSDADVELLVAEVVADIPTAKQATDATAAADAELSLQGVSLSDLRRAVAAGRLTLDQFAAELTARNLSADAVALLRELLDDQVALDRTNLEKKITDALAGVDGAPTLDELQAAIEQNQASDAVIVQYLTRAGVSADVAAVYVRLVHAFAPAGR